MVGPTTTRDCVRSAGRWKVCSFCILRIKNPASIIAIHAPRRGCCHPFMQRLPHASFGLTPWREPAGVDPLSVRVEKVVGVVETSVGLSGSQKSRVAAEAARIFAQSSHRV